jgi:hypothetical protein
MLAFAAATTLALTRRKLLGSSAASSSASPSSTSSFSSPNVPLTPTSTTTASTSSGGGGGGGPRFQRRASIDMGSGATKLMVADVDVRTNRIVRTLYGSERLCSYSLASKQTPDGSLTDEVMEIGMRVLLELRRIARDLMAPGSLPPDTAVVPEIAAIATEVFRKAPNGAAFLARVHAETGIRVHPVTQSMEAELGFLTAAAYAK